MSNWTKLGQTETGDLLSKSGFTNCLQITHKIIIYLSTDGTSLNCLYQSHSLFPLLLIDCLMIRQFAFVSDLFPPVSLSLIFAINSPQHSLNTIHVLNLLLIRRPKLF